MRITNKGNLTRDISELGFSESERKVFTHILKNPHGIILVTGPTGSGKSTTLYTALSELNTEAVNIITVEDPVEANVAGINQVQTNVKAGLTFASALRSILRQDPDIIMIGEIRDGETAKHCGAGINHRSLGCQYTAYELGSEYGFPSGRYGD